MLRYIDENEGRNASISRLFANVVEVVHVGLAKDQNGGRDSSLGRGGVQRRPEQDRDRDSRPRRQQLQSCSAAARGRRGRICWRRTGRRSRTTSGGSCCPRSPLGRADQNSPAQARATAAEATNERTLSFSASVSSPLPRSAASASRARAPPARNSGQFFPPGQSAAAADRPADSAARAHSRGGQFSYLRARCPPDSFPAGGVSRLGGAGAGAAAQADVEQRCAEMTENEVDGRDGGDRGGRRRREKQESQPGRQPHEQEDDEGGVDDCHAGKCDVAFQCEHHHVRGETRNKYKYRASQRWEILAHVLQLHCVIYLLRQSASFSISKQLQLVRSLVELLSNMLVAADSYISIDVAYRLDPTLKSEAR